MANRFTTVAAQPTPPRTVEIDTVQSIFCMAANKDCSLAVVAGRAILKVYSIDEESIEEKMNLRPTQKSNLTFVANDIVWSPHDESFLASAATNGNIVIWDLNKSSRNRQAEVFPHDRTVYRLCYHPTERLLLSGSKEGCKLYDLRRKDPVLSFNPSAVHDVQWWPQESLKFASATDNGSIQIWDSRQPSTCVSEFPAHGGPVFAIDFHPSNKDLLATGGRDKLIKIWNLSEISNYKSSTRNLQQKQIMTIASVCRIRWRPDRQTQIASVAMNFDHGINVWDLERPYIPVAMFTEHTEPVTGMVWNNAHAFLSSGKDHKLIKHVYTDAMRIGERMNPVAIDINKCDEIMLALKQKPHSQPVKSTPLTHSPSTPVSGNRSAVFNLFPGPKPQPITQSTVSHIVNKREAFVNNSKSVLYFHTDSLYEFDSKWFKHCAENYILYGKTLDEMCSHNAKVALDYDKIQIMKMWNMIMYYHGVIADGQTSHQNSSRTEHSDAQNNGDKPDVFSNGNHTEVHFTESDTQSEENDSEDIQSSLIVTQNQDFFYEDIEIDLFDEMDDPDLELDRDDDMLPTEGFTIITDLQLNEAHHVNTESFTPTRSLAASIYPEHQNDERLETKPPEQVKVLDIDCLPLWNPVDIIVDMLTTLAQDGDVQSAVCMLIILGNKIKSHIQQDTAGCWIHAYLELLERFKLWQHSNSIIKRCDYTPINQLNQQSTTIHSQCSKCGRSINPREWWCKRCKRSVTTCALCHVPVKGVYVWCQGCSHGGHINHMKDWFKTHSQCPCCGHLCEFT